MFRKLHLYFLPHPDNNHRAFILQPKFLAFLIFIYLLNQSFLRSLTVLKPGILGYASEITSQKVFEFTNQERLKYDLPPLSFNSTLARSATAKAQDMFENNYWAHTSPTGTNPWDFFKQEGYQYSIAGENLAKDFYDTETVIKAWMNSPTHKANIINSKYREIGIGIVNGTLNGIKTTLVVQHFGTPISGIVSGDQTSEENNYNTDKVGIIESPEIIVNPAVSKTINPVTVSKTLGLIMFTIILSVLLIDAYLTYKNKTYRLSGSSAGHISFLAIIFLLLLFSHQGTIF
ncbi:hypothetical protein A2410_02620 [Candidatus Shapirobacteria bacterium RIFOXYC1_FULL_38_24]|uniref:SCP domain-containing protein n=2 Tax=Candidatus Shapironibacteriota TaxID=1752721 RepID=A0A0G0JSR5_9BACT|nr:MAG: hypothetical protein US90_C0013G0013 [Candidatus Shapirobacteria bacterium GW2011_GWE2_38_30]OGL55698.1 MAG: hypothetical protein A2195_00045 [Candidatus Shapirobacteria bacterium RIFOXYA1_FULL_39_17]OGL57356.1 MAG: hypothetical protein A2410_02620 [Candidatus Shapirobacteria bacterium RIFOXYC1_FULL_38_24]HCU55224.1 hypothetical protein [Candidatus Shapirobacteria bacterium]